MSKVLLSPYSFGGSQRVSFVVGSQRVSSLSFANKDVHPFTHTLTSTAQDGSRYLIVGFFADGIPAPSVVDSKLTPITTPPSGSGTQIANLWYYYKFTSGDITAGSVSLSFTKAGEIGQYVTFEVAGANATNPVGGTAFDRSSSATRTNAGPVALTPAVGGCLLVASLGADPASGDTAGHVVTMPIANGFTMFANFDARGDGDPAIGAAYREVSTPGSYDSPQLRRTPAGASIQLEAFWLVP